MSNEVEDNSKISPLYGYNFKDDGFQPATDRTLLTYAKQFKAEDGKLYDQRVTQFCDLFFSGGSIEFKPELKQYPMFVKETMTYLKSFMSSFMPKHEEKEAICAFILNELTVLPEKKDGDFKMTELRGKEDG